MLAPKISRVICFGYYSSPKKLIISTKISCPTFNIHKSKFDVVEWHYIKVGKTYNCFVFPINLDNNSIENCFLERKTIIGHKCILNILNQLLFKKFKGIWFLTIKRPKSSKKCFSCTSFVTGTKNYKNMN